jgi:hypothetical protein
MGNIITLITSNHPPAPALGDIKEVLMQPPAAEQMQRWCINTMQDQLEAALKEANGGVAVEVQQV